MHDGWRLPHRSIHWWYVRHMGVRGDYDRRPLRLELARRHGVLWLGLRRLVGVPLLHGLHVLGIAVGRTILLLVVVVGRIWVVVDGRVRLRRHLVVVLLFNLPSARHIRAWHVGVRRGGCL